jgi:hypothetical protein
VSKVASNGSFAVAFSCDAIDLVREFTPPNNENTRQVYVKFYSNVTSPGTTILASGGLAGITTRGGNGISDQPTIALIGESPLLYRICFRTRASDLLNSGTGPLVYPEVVCEVVDHNSASIVNGSRLSVKPNLSEPDGLNDPFLSADGSILAFSSTGTMIPGLTGNGNRQVYTYSFASNEISLVSYKAGGSLSAGGSTTPSLSSNGSAIAFQHQPSSNGLDLKGLTGGINALFVVREGGAGSGFRQLNTSAAGIASDASSSGGDASCKFSFCGVF